MTNGLGGVTTYSWGMNGSGQTVYTNINPDLGTVITTNHADGSVLRIGGTAAQPIDYLYGVDGASEPFTVSRKLTASGTNEWSTTYLDRIGRNLRTQYSSGTNAQCSFYNNKGQLIQSLDPDGVMTLYDYDAKGEQVTQAVHLGAGTNIDYSNDRITYSTNDVVTTNGLVAFRTLTYGWKTGSAPTPLSVRVNSADRWQSWQETWNNGSVATTNGSRTFYPNPATGYHYVTNFAPNGAYTASTYLNGRLVSVTQKDAGNNQIGQKTYGYDVMGRQNTVTDARNGTTTTSFNAADLTSAVTTPGPGLVTASYYDSSLRPTLTGLPDGTFATNVYTPASQVNLSYGSRAYPTGTGFDAQGRMTALTNWTSYPSTGSRVTSWTYDANRGWLASKSYNGSNGPAYTYTDTGRLNTRLWARGTNTAYGYNGAGDLATVKYTDGGVTAGLTNNYDRMGRKTIVTNGATVTTLVYNDAGLLLMETNSGGVLDKIAVVYSYDSYFRRTGVQATLNGAALTTQTGYGYDAAARLVLVSNVQSGIPFLATYSYLANSPLVSQIQFKSNSFVAVTTTKDYDAVNRLKSIVSTPTGGSTQLPMSYSYQYNAASQRTRMTLYDNSYWLYGYDSLGQVTSGKKYWADGTPVPGEQFGNTFDEIGNRTATTQGGDSHGGNLRSASYSVNDLNQYTSRTVPNGFDILGLANVNASVKVNGNASDYRRGEFYQKLIGVANSNVPVFLTVTNTATNAGAHTDVTGNYWVPKTPESFGYDYDGNMTGDGRWNCAWDAENRLLQLVSATAVGPQQMIKFDYDYQGRRIRKRVWNNTAGTGSPALEQHFVWDGWNLLAVLDSAQTLQQSFMWGLDLSGSIQGAGGVGGLLSMTIPSGQANPGTFFYCMDGNGNVGGLVNAKTGTIAALYEHGPFGELIRQTGQLASANCFLFSTKWYDWETGWYYYGYRYFSPTLARWASRDPMGEAGFELTRDDQDDVVIQSRNTGGLYVFVNNNATAAIDPLGLWPSAHSHIGVIIGLSTPTTHENAIHRAIPGLTAADYDILDAAQVEVDESQGTALSYEHAMRDGLANQSVSQARDLANQFVRQHLILARKLLCKCPSDRKEALHMFGMALHTIQDFTSPAHTGFQPWNGDGSGHRSEAIVHLMKEDYDPGAGSQLDSATAWLWTFFACPPSAPQLPTDYFSALGADPVNPAWQNSTAPQQPPPYLP